MLWYIIFFLIALLIFYELVKHAVKNGILEAHDEMEERKRQAEEEKMNKTAFAAKEPEKKKELDTDFFYYDGADGNIGKGNLDNFEISQENIDKQDKSE